MNTENFHFLELNKNPVHFDPVSRVTNVFFDESNLQVFAVRSGGETGVVVKGPTNRNYFTFCMKDRGPLISVKFSYHHKILAMQRSDRSVEFANFEKGETDPIEYSQTCKGRNNKIIAFHWISMSEIIFITENGIEYYQLNTEKRFLKLIKSHTLSINWAVFSSEASVVLVSSGPATLLVPFYIKNGQISKLQKFDVDPPKSGGKFLERDVTLLNLYKTLYAGVVRHPGVNSNEKCVLDLYLLNKDSTVLKSFVLQLGKVGRFAINVVDNLVVAHHQVSKTSVAFDVKLPGISRSNVVNLEPILGPLPIKPYLLKKQEFDIRTGPNITEEDCELYSKTWIVFRPNIVIDAALGCMWFIHLNLESMMRLFQDQSLLVDFLLLRKGSKPTLLEVLKNALSCDDRSPISQIGSFFSKLNQVYKDYIDAEQYYADKSDSDSNRTPHHREWLVLDQNDISMQVLKPFTESECMPGPHKIAVLTEYIRSLDTFKIKVKHFVFELLINTLVHEGSYFQLQLLLRHQVIQDSKQVACSLLALESAHPPCFELALDMLKRLATSDEQVVEVMLSKQMILTALRFIRHVGMHDLVPARKFLAASRHDDQLFYSVYKFFEARNIRIHGKPEFTADDRCNDFMDYYVSRFN